MFANFGQALSIATQKHMAGGAHRVEAEHIYHQLVCTDPDHAFLNFAVGTLYTDTDQMAFAFPFLLRSVALDPTNCQAWNNLGAAYKSYFHHDKAERALAKAFSIDPTNAAIYANYSGLYINEGCPEKAIPWAKKGLLYDPESPQLHNHYALACLEMGEWTDAWPHWEWRTKLPQWYQRVFPKPTRLWRGEKVKSLALSGEQGIGDEILFSSIVPEIRNRVTGDLFIECTERLQILFERSFGCKTYPSHQELVFHEHNIEANLQLGSLPRLFRPSPTDCPGTPFLKANPDTVEEFKNRLARVGPPPYIGLAWQGGYSQNTPTCSDPWVTVFGLDRLY